MKHPKCEKEEWELPTNITRPGTILYKHYLIIMGGGINTNKFTDDVYLLNLKHNDSWMPSIKTIPKPMSPTSP